VITFEDTLGVCTAGTEPQIRTRLWGELSKWFVQLPEALRGVFEMTATAIFNRQSERTHRVDGRPWSERNQEAFSGLHNFGKRVLMIMDEASMIPDPIWRACDGMLNDAQTEIVSCVFGNPLRLDGRFPTCFPGGKFSGMWHSIQVDSRTVSLTDKASINEKLAYYGETSNYARSHVLGQFPTASTTQLIPSDWVEGAALRETWQHPADPLILGCDVASGHGEDSSVIYIRRGLDGRSHPPRKFPNTDPVQFAYKIAEAANELGADAIFVDAGGVGEGTAARLRELGLSVHAVYFGAKADYSPDVRCANKRSAMWCAMAQWLKAGAIPNDPELKAQLIGPEASENAQGVLLERKEDMRSRGLASPDIADALALTFGLARVHGSDERPCRARRSPSGQRVESIFGRSPRWSPTAGDAKKVYCAGMAAIARFGQSGGLGGAGCRTGRMAGRGRCQQLVRCRQIRDRSFHSWRSSCTTWMPGDRQCSAHGRPCPAWIATFWRTAMWWEGCRRLTELTSDDVLAHKGLGSGLSRRHPHRFVRSCGHSDRRDCATMARHAFAIGDAD
jgi:hypothetical protein